MGVCVGTTVLPGGIPVNSGYAEDMRRARPVVLRQQLLLWAAVVVVALGLLAMHQLSLNHTAAGSAAGSAAAAVAAHPEQHGHSDSGPAADGHAHPALVAVGDHPSSGADTCPGCADHVMALTCLAALALLAVGWALRRPVVWRGVRLPRLVWRPLPPDPRWRRAPLTLVELAVSRT